MKQFSGFTLRSLTTKIALTIIVASMVAVVIVTTLSVRREQATFRAELQQQANALLATLAEASDNALYRLDVEIIELLTDGLAETDVSDTVRFYDGDGRLIADSTAQRTLTFNQTIDPYGAELLESDGTQYSWQPDLLLAGRRVQLGNRAIGAVSIGLSTAAINAKVAAARSQAIYAGLGAVVLSVGLAIVLSRTIIRPLNKLTDAAQQVADGDYSQKVAVTTGDELEALGEAFNAMTKGIQKRTQDLETAHQDLKRAHEDLLVANQARDQFLANVSHELRTPLNAIIGFSDILLMGMTGPLNEKQQDRIERLRGNGHRLLSLVNDILDLSRLEAGRFSIHEEQFDVQQMVRRISDQMNILADKGNLSFEVEMAETLPDWLVGDVQRIEQVVVNLLSNAFKFTDTGSVLLSVRPTDDGDNWTLAVKDTGSGIPPQALELIFESFHQVDGSYTRAHEGTGLGLAITQRIVKLMGGTIHVDSTLGKGSTFTITLPLVLPDKDPHKTQTVVAHKEESQQ